MKISDIKISNQIRIVQIIIIVLIVALGLYCYFAVNLLLNNSETFRNHPIVTQAALSSIKGDIYNIRLLMQDIVLGDTGRAIQIKENKIYSYQDDAVKQVEILSNSYLGPMSDLETLKSDILLFQEIRTETLRLQSVGNFEEARKRVMYGGIGEAQVERIMASVNKMETFAANKANQIYEDTKKQGNQIFSINAILINIIIIFVVVLLSFFAKSIRDPLNEIGKAISNFEQGKLTTRSLNVSKNEIGRIANAFNLMTERIERESQDKIFKAAELLVAKTEISTQAALIIMQKAYYMDKQLYQATLLSIGDAVISCDINSNIIFMNKVAETLTGWKAEDAIGQPVEKIFNIVHEVTHERCENIVKQVILTKTINELEYHTVLIGKDGDERSVEDSAAPIFNENGELAGAVLVFRDVTEKREAIRDIEYLSYHDKLTGLYNRRYFEEEINRLDTGRNLPLTIVMGDANGLKLINDSFGHATGDQLLQKAANAIKNGCRSDDIIARMGGDEFVALLPNTNKEEAEVIINRIRENLLEDKLNNLPISVSFGHATKEDIDQNIQEILKTTEDDMYKQKLYESSSMRSRTVDLIMNTLYEKNMREMLHSKRVGEFCEALAIKMHFDNEDINKIRLAGLMHDIGKIAIDEGILNKVGEITQLEFNEIKRHSEIGYRILSSVYEFSEIASFVLEHHERWDGQGYPKGLSGKDISIQARMICIADAYDAMTSERTYKEIFSLMEAINEIRRCSGIQFDPEITESFIEVALEMSSNSTNN
jgi:diguanylate cyclase (GGDEF)-like protein/PAS domain S-box-containing protein/putative nucleotidyltransferase with HDIG domain